MAHGWTLSQLFWVGEIRGSCEYNGPARPRVSHCALRQQRWTMEWLLIAVVTCVLAPFPGKGKSAGTSWSLSGLSHIFGIALAVCVHVCELVVFFFFLKDTSSSLGDHICSRGGFDKMQSCAPVRLCVCVSPYRCVHLHFLELCGTNRI